MHVLLLATEFPPFTIGGLGTHLGHLVSGLSRHDLYFSILVGSQGNRQSIREHNREVLFLDPPDMTPLEGFFDRFYQHSAAIERKAISFFEEQRKLPDLIHCHDWLSFPCAERLRSRWDIPIISSVHCIDHPMSWRWGESSPRHVAEIEEAMRAKADLLIAVSNSVRDEVCRLSPAASSKIRTIHNGLSETADIPADATAWIQALQDQESNPDKQLVVFAGRLIPQKGVRFLLDAARILGRSREDVSIVIAGDYESGYGALLRGHTESDDELRKIVCFIGRLALPQLRALYRRARLAVVPSLYEPFGYAAIEAMAEGIPVIASACGGLPEIIEHRKSGLLLDLSLDERGFASVDPKQLAEYIVMLIDDTKTAKQYAEAGRLRVKEFFGAAQMAAETYQAYRDICAVGTVPPPAASVRTASGNTASPLHSPAQLRQQLCEDAAWV